MSLGAPWLEVGRGFAMATLVAAVAVGCGGEEGDFLPRYAGEPNADDFSIDAKLVREARCLYLDTNAGERIFPIFPGRDAAFDDEGNELTVEGAEAKVGEVVHLLGSGGPMPPYDFEWANRPDESCDTEVIWFVGLRDG